MPISLGALTSGRSGLPSSNSSHNCPEMMMLESTVSVVCMPGVVGFHRLGESRQFGEHLCPQWTPKTGP
jgi:hypothetical protein